MPANHSLIVPSDAKNRAQVGLTLLKETVLELVKANPGGIRNIDAADSLALHSEYNDQ